MPKTPSSKPRRHSKKFLGLMVLLAVCIIGAASLLIWHYENERAIAADRLRFEQADKDVKAVATSIENTVPPEKKSLVEECTHQSREFQAEPLVCSTTYKIFYGANTISEVNQRIEALNKVLRNDRRFEYRGLAQKPVDYGGESASFSDFPAAGSTSVLSLIYKDNASQFICPLSYEVYNSTSTPAAVDYSSSNQALSIAVTFLCSSSARSAIYPVDDNI